MVPAIQDAHEIQVQRSAARSAAAATLGPCFIAVVVRLGLRSDLDDDVAELLAGLDVLECLDDLVERVCPVDHRREVAVGEPVPEKLDVILGAGGIGKSTRPGADELAERAGERDSGFWPFGPSSVDMYTPPGTNSRLQAANELFADGVEHDVEPLVVGGEVAALMVDHAIRAERRHDADHPAGARRHDVGTEVPAQLDGGRADRARCAVDEQACSASELSPPAGRRGRSGLPRSPLPPARRRRRRGSPPPPCARRSPCTRRARPSPSHRTRTPGHRRRTGRRRCQPRPPSRRTHTRAPDAVAVAARRRT